MCALKIAGGSLLLFSAFLLNAGERDHRLLSTTVLTRQIHALEGPQDGMPTDPSALKLRVTTMRHDIGNFVIRQIGAYPSISACDLQKQLDSVFAEQDDCCARLASASGAPHVFVNSSGPKTIQRVFVVTYSWFGFYGKAGSQTVLECYVWEPDRDAHLAAGLVPASFSGLLTNTGDLSWFPNLDRYWILVSGTAGGASGRVLPGSAAVFEIGPDRVRTVWTAPLGIGNVVAHPLPDSHRWEIQYADTKRFYSNLPKASFLDIYQVDYTSRAFHRLVHEPLD
jgi:hypothetical protein